MVDVSNLNPAGAITGNERIPALQGETPVYFTAADIAGQAPGITVTAGGSAYTGITALTIAGGLEATVSSGVATLQVSGGGGAVPLSSLPQSVQDSILIVPFGASPVAGMTVYVPIPAGVIIPANWSGSFGFAPTSATSNTAFSATIISGGSATSLGTITISGGAAAATFPTESATSVAGGSILAIAAPGTADATLSSPVLAIVVTKE